MRPELLWNPRLLCERLAELSLQRRRLARLKKTPGEHLERGHVDSLELLEILREMRLRTIYDVGANTGTWTLLAKSLFPLAELHAFEPLPAHWPDFERLTASVTGVRLHKIALGGKKEVAEMHIATKSDASSLLELAPEAKTLFGLSTAGSTDVEVERLDDYVQRAGLPPPDLIKLDIQGMELEALRGAPNTLAHSRAALAEVSFTELYRGQCLFHELVHFLAERKFYLRALGRNTQLGQKLVQADALFLRAV